MPTFKIYGTKKVTIETIVVAKTKEKALKAAEDSSEVEWEVVDGTDELEVAPNGTADVELITPIDGPTEEH